MDYDNTLVSWKLPLKKQIEVKINNSEPMTSQHNDVPLISIPSTISTSHGPLQITHLSHFDLIPTQHFHTNNQHHNLHPQHNIEQLINNSKIELHHQLNNDKIEIHHHTLHEQQHVQHSQQHQQQQQMHQPQQQQQQQHQPKQKRFEKTKDRTNKKNFKIRKIPVVDMAYHSKQFGLKVPPKKVNSWNNLNYLNDFKVCSNIF